MIISCVKCPTRYRFDESRIPDRGLLVRCTRCGETFRSFRPGGEKGSAAAPRQAAPPVETSPPAKATKEAAQADPAATEEAPPADRRRPKRRRKTGAGERTPQEEIERLARVVFSDIEVYNPEKVKQAITQGRFNDQFAEELEEARRMIKDRFSKLDDAVALFDGAIEQICERRRDRVSTAT